MMETFERVKNIKTQLYNEIYNPQEFDLQKLVQDLEFTRDYSLLKRISKRHQLLVKVVEGGNGSFIRLEKNSSHGIPTRILNANATHIPTATAGNLMDLIDIELNLKSL